MKPGLRLPWFLHEDKDEMIVVLQGAGVMYFKSAEPIELKSGDTLCVPAGIEHSLENTGDSDFEAIFFKVLC